MNFLLTENRLKNDLSNSSLSVMWFIFELIIAISDTQICQLDISRKSRSRC